MKQLDKELNILDLEERKQILDFYEERFYSGTVYEKKTEMEVISELESPQAIAKNVLEEYGVSPKFIKTSEERYTGIRTSRLVFLILFDVFIVSWLIPTLFSVAIAIIASLVSYIGVADLIIGAHTVTDLYLFVFLTGGFILLFLIGLLVLDICLYVTKAIVNYHLNVLKYRKRDKVRKYLRKISVDEWLKKRKLLSFVRSISFVAALLLMGYGVLKFYTGDENFFDIYANNPENIDVHTEDLSLEIANSEIWEIVTDFDYLQVELVSIEGDEVIITHTYDEFNEFVLTFDYDNNKITITNDSEEFFVFDVRDILKLLGDTDTLKIEVPENLLLRNVEVSTVYGKITVSNVEVMKLSAKTTNGRITIDYVVANDDINLRTTNGEISVRNSNGGINSIDADTSNGDIIIKNSAFRDYNLDTTNGDIVLENLNLISYDGNTLYADTTNGDIDLENVYVSKVYLETTNENIDYDNDDTSFILDELTMDKTNGNISSNVD